MDTLKFTKIANVKSPKRANLTDAGIDFFIPDDFMETWIQPNGSILIHGGLKVKVPKGYALIFFNKSGVATKKDLVLGACVTGETIIQTNKGNFPCHILTKQFCNENDILIKGYDLQRKIYDFYKCDGFRPIFRSQCIRITFEDNSVIEGDENHFIFDETLKVWKRLKDL